VACAFVGYAGSVYVNQQVVDGAPARAASKPTLSTQSVPTTEPTPPTAEVDGPCVYWADIDPTGEEWLRPGVEYRMTANVYFADEFDDGGTKPTIYLGDAKVMVGGEEAVITVGRWDYPFADGVTYDVRVVYWERIDGIHFFHVIEVVDWWLTGGEGVPGGTSA